MNKATLALVFCCGGLGAALRVSLQAHLLSRAISGHWATTMINFTGCFVAGLLSHWVQFLSPGLRLAVFGGLLGGFTTMSAFAFDASLLLNQRSSLYSFGFIACTVVGCIASFMFGVHLMRGFK